MVGEHAVVQVSERVDGHVLEWHAHDIHQRGTTVLLVEQNASRALQLATRGYVMESGEITMSGAGSALLNDPKVRAAYLGE